MVVRLETKETTEPASGSTVGGKEGGERPEKTPMSKTLATRPMGRESLSPHPTP